MIIYLLKFSACLTIFIIFYKLLLEKASIHKFKRLYLLSALALALVIPSLTVIEYIEPAIVEEYTSFLVPDFKITETLPEIIEVNYTPIILWSLYGLGVFIFLLKFCLNLNNIISRIKSNTKLKSGSFINVLVSNLKIPHTFFNYIFFNKYKFEHNGIPKEVLIHEQTHAKQKHSIDVLLLELLQIIFWFNPLIYLLKRDVKLNHEFLADRAVLENGIEPSTYQTILLAFSSKAEDQNPIDIGMANAINYSSIKKRFTVMNTHTSKQSIWVRSLLILPVLAILFYGFTEREQIERNINPEKLDNQKLKSLDDILTEEQKQLFENHPILYIIEKDEYYKNARFQFKNNDKNNSVIKSYSELSKEEKQNLLDPPTRPMKRQPNNDKLNEWNDEGKFGIWVDGLRIQNVLLNKYNSSNFSFYRVSKLKKNALNYGSHYYQVSLYSSDYYEEKYKDGIEPLSSSALIIIKKAKSQEKASPKQVAEYNKLAKKISAQPKDNQIIKIKDIERINYLYKLMSATQKDSAKPFPSYPPPPPPPAPPIKVIKSEITWILLNSKGQFLLNERLSKLEFIELELKDIASVKGNSKEIVFKHDDDAPKDLINKVNAIIANYNLKNITEKIPLPPAAPPKTKSGNGPNVGTYYPVPPPLPENATPEQRFKMQAVIDDFEKTYKRKVHQSKISSGEMISTVADDDYYDPSKQDNYKVKTGFIKINRTPHYFVTINDLTKYYNREGFVVNKSGEKISKSQVNASNVIPGQYITKVYSDSKVVSEFYNNRRTSFKTTVDIPSPPKLQSPLDYITDLAKKDAELFYENEKITSDKAITLLKGDKKLNIQTIKTDSNQHQVFISKEPVNTNRGESKIPVKINGRASKDNQFKLSSKKVQALKLTLDDTQVISFKVKFRGKPTQVITGHELNKITKGFVRQAKEGTQVQLFDIKDNDGFTHPPVVIKITDQLIGVMGKNN